MSIGTPSPLYALGCEQRAPLLDGLFGWRAPMTASACAQVAAVKAALYAGFRRAAAAIDVRHDALVTVDPDWGGDIFRHATARGFLTAVTLDPFDGDAADLDVCAALRAMDELPAPFAKVSLVADASGARHARAIAQLRRLMVPLRARGRRLVVELRGDPLVALHAMRRLQDGGIEPEVWMLDPLDGEAARLAAAMARRDGRQGVRCLVLLRGDPGRAQKDAATAGGAGVLGFGIDPSLWRADVDAWRAGVVTWDGLVWRVAGSCRGYVEALRAQWARQAEADEAQCDRTQSLQAKELGKRQGEGPASASVQAGTTHACNAS